MYIASFISIKSSNRSHSSFRNTIHVNIMVHVSGNAGKYRYDIQTQISKLIEPLYAKMLTAIIVVLIFLQQVVVAMGDGVKQVLYQHGI